MGLKDSMRGLEALEAQHQNAILERTHDCDVQLEIAKAQCEERTHDRCFNEGKGELPPPGTPYAPLQRSVRKKNV